MKKSISPEDLAAVSAKELKEGWPTYLFQTTPAQRPEGFQELPIPLTLRSAFLHELLGENVMPTDRQFEIMADLPIDGSLSREEMERCLAA